VVFYSCADPNEILIRLGQLLGMSLLAKLLMAKVFQCFGCQQNCARAIKMMQKGIISTETKIRPASQG